MNKHMIALVTGANKGIGRQIAGQLAALGHTVVVAARNADAGERAAAELRAEGGNAVAVVLDVTDPASAAAAADNVKRRFRRLDALVNNAGIVATPGSALLPSSRARPTWTRSAPSLRPTSSASFP